MILDKKPRVKLLSGSGQDIIYERIDENWNVRWGNTEGIYLIYMLYNEGLISIKCKRLLYLKNIINYRNVVSRSCRDVLKNNI